MHALSVPGSGPVQLNAWVVYQQLMAFHAAMRLAMSILRPQAPAFPMLIDIPPSELKELVMPMFTPFQLLITPCTALGAGSQLKRAMLHCNCQTTGQVSPMGLYYEMPSKKSMQGHTLSETSAGKYRQHWRTASELPRYGTMALSR